MLTASYLTDSWRFRPEFKSTTTWSGLDETIQPLDAPRTIAGGSVKRFKAVSYDGEYVLQYAVARE